MFKLFLKEATLSKNKENKVFIYTKSYEWIIRLKDDVMDIFPAIEKNVNKSLFTYGSVQPFSLGTLPYALITEACSADSSNPGGYSAILAQIKPDEEFEVIRYASQKLKCHKKNCELFLLEIAASS